MKKISATELRRRFAYYKRRVQRGESFFITRYRRVLAIMEPPRPEDLIVRKPKRVPNYSGESVA